MGTAQLVHDPLDLAKAEGTPFPVLAIQRHIGSIYQGLHRSMLLQPRLEHTTKGVFRVFPLGERERGRFKLHSHAYTTLQKVCFGFLGGGGVMFRV